MISLEITSGTYWLFYYKAKTIKKMENYLRKKGVLKKNKTLNDYRHSYFPNEKDRKETNLKDTGDLFFDGKMYHFNINADGRKLKGYKYVTD